MAVLKRQQLDKTVARRSVAVTQVPELPEPESQPPAEPQPPETEPQPSGPVPEQPGNEVKAPEDVDPWQQEGELLAKWQEQSSPPPPEETGPKNRSPQDRRGAYRRVEEKELISRAEQEAESIRENARQQGYQQGLEEALSKSEADLQEIHGMLVQLMSGREEALQSVSNEIAGLAVQVAEQIIKTEVSCDDTLVLNLVQDVIQKAGRNIKSLTVKVHPQQLSMVKAALKPNSANDILPPGLQADITVTADPSVDFGSCIIETSSGMVDARFQTQLAFLRKLLGIQTPVAVSSTALSETASLETETTPEGQPSETPDPDPGAYKEPFSDVIESSSSNDSGTQSGFSLAPGT